MQKRDGKQGMRKHKMRKRNEKTTIRRRTGVMGKRSDGKQGTRHVRKMEKNI